MNIEEFKSASKEKIEEYGKTLEYGISRNSHNLISSIKYENEFWVEYTYNTNNKILTHINSNFIWYEWTYDSDDNKLTYKNSMGFDGISLVNNKYFTLYYDENSDKYSDGLITKSYDDFLKYYENNKTSIYDEELLIETIKSHHTMNLKSVL